MLVKGTLSVELPKAYVARWPVLRYFRAIQLVRGTTVSLFLSIAGLTWRLSPMPCETADQPVGK